MQMEWNTNNHILVAVVVLWAPIYLPVPFHTTRAISVNWQLAWLANPHGRSRAS